jgi:hypothetical protein
MRKPAVGLGLLLSVNLVWAEQSSSTPTKASTPDALKAEIAALKPADHVWRAITWRICPLEALKASREQKKPIIAWVFLGIPTDERC